MSYVPTNPVIVQRDRSVLHFEQHPRYDVTRETHDQDFAANRQMFLTEQGYHYTILDAREVLQQQEYSA
jgi:hypothetical protein